jgi:hypothetical protein
MAALIDGPVNVSRWRAPFSWPITESPTNPHALHIHSVVRTPNGNDYGKDLLRQHYQQHPHPHRH